MAEIFPGRTIALDLRRENYRASGALAWARTAEFAPVAARADEFLHAEEREAYAALKVDRRRASYLLGRFTAKSALAKCAGAGFRPTQTVIVAGIFSQPVVHGQAARTLGVSISHCDCLVGSVAFPEEHPMAIDVETIDPARTKVMLTQIRPEENELARARCGSPDLAATLVWSAKEALSKALRCGMTCPFELLEICELEACDGGWTGRFRNFAQYKFQTCQRGDTAITIVLPKKTELGGALPDSL
jgi:4'-phosphopantetheinyl transferase EntD